MEQNKREIKFRGIATETVEDICKKNEWVYGNLVWNYGPPYIIGDVAETDEEHFNPEFWVPVEKESVGQKTGLLGKNGKEIYCGDIVRFDNRKRLCKIVWSDKYACFALIEDGDYKPYTLYEQFNNNLPEVIGNIYENPNLLSEKEEPIKEVEDKAREEEREKMVRIQFPKTIQRIEQEAERRGAINILKKVRDSADGLYDEDRDWHEVLYGVLEAELKLLEEENGKQNAR